jgi:alkaline phosphatase D
VGPDRDNKHDNHSNKDFAHEGNELREFIASQQNIVVVCGDRHRQYVSVDPQTGLREYSCGPVSDKHAGGWSQDDFREKYHRYLNVIGGFLSVTVALFVEGPYRNVGQASCLPRPGQNMLHWAGWKSALLVLAG